MFADIRDFTPLSEKLGPEETIDRLNTYYTLMFDAISGHGGVVNLIAGDGLMAIFGAPLPLPGHCEAAVRAAVEMIELVELFDAERIAAGKLPIRIGVGIATGGMVAGYAGTNERATYTCIGDVVNLASRIEEYTKVAKCQLLIDAATRAGLPVPIAVESLGPVTFRGMSAPAEVFVVRDAAGRP
jgi:class 3 adenylate cyclase